MSALLLCGLVSAFCGTAQARDSTYSSPGVRALVEAAAERQRPPSGGAAWFTSRIESEIGLLILQPDGEQVLTGVEQFGGRVSWSSDGSLVQSVTAYRGRLVGPTVSTLSYMRGPWVMGPLVGDRVPLALSADSTRRPAAETSAPSERSAPGEATDASGRRRELPLVVNPLGSDRGEYYRFSGGDTVLTLRLPERTVPIVRIVVEPRTSSARALLFRGEIHLDAVGHGVVRVRGEMMARARKRPLVSRVLNAALEPHFWVDVENALGDVGDWLPHRQWIELEVGSPLSDDAAVLRIVTAFSMMVPDSAPRLEGSAAQDGAKRALLVLSTAAAAGGAGWQAELGAATAERDSRDLADLRTRSAPEKVRFGTGGVSKAVRYDRVEGLFTGGGLRAGPGGRGPGKPGPFAALHGGWAWAEGTARGGAELGLAGSRWEVAAGAERELASTNDFPRPLETGPTVFGVFGIDELDYVDRYSAGVRAAFHARSGPSVRATVAAVRDRAPAVNAERPPLGGSFRPLRAVAAGDYAHVGLAVALGSGRGGEFLAPGWGAEASWEWARGDLSWRRVEASVRARRQRGRWSGAALGFAGAVASEDPPPQALFEIGGYSGRLPGFPYKAFTGDRAAVGMVEAAYALPLLERPLRIGPLFLPSPSPSPLGQLSAGWTGASPDAAPVLAAYGWEPSDGVRATAFLGARFFGGFLRLGAARALRTSGRWRLQLELGG